MTGPTTEDRLAIYELYARYSWALDTGDTDGYVALFTADGFGIHGRPASLRLTLPPLAAVFLRPER